MKFRAIVEKMHLDSSNGDDLFLFDHFCHLSAFPEFLTLLKLDKSGIKLPLDFQSFVLISTFSATVRLEWLLANSFAAKFGNII
jgi:hypothetical protein